MLYQTILARLQRAHDVPAENLSAFSARTKHIQKLGWPVGTNTGRGRAADWTERHYQELFFVMEICAIGIPPERAIEIVKSNLPLLHATAELEGKCTVHCPSSFGGSVPRTTLAVDLSKIVAVTKD